MYSQNISRFIKIAGLFLVFAVAAMTLVKMSFSSNNDKKLKEQAQLEQMLQTQNALQTEETSNDDEQQDLMHKRMQQIEENQRKNQEQSQRFTQDYKQNNQQNYNQDNSEYFQEDTEHSYNDYNQQSYNQEDRQDFNKNDEKEDISLNYIRQYNKTKSKEDFLRLTDYLLSIKDKTTLKTYYRNYKSIHDEPDWEIDRLEALF